MPAQNPSQVPPAGLEASSVGISVEPPGPGSFVNGQEGRATVESGMTVQVPQPEVYPPGRRRYPGLEMDWLRQVGILPRK